MPPTPLDRRRLRFRPLAERENRARIERDAVLPGRPPGPMSDAARASVARTAERITAARKAGRPVMMAFGAHTIKNGLAPVLIHMMERGWVTHLATNGAGVIHDWEFAYIGETSEHVAANVRDGCFGAWEETGYYINLAILLGACRGMGYGESVGAFIEQGVLEIPTRDDLIGEIRKGLRRATTPEDAAAAADLLLALDRCGLKPGRIEVPHPFKRYSAQAAAFRLGVPFTAHPMIGHDIIYMHPLSSGAAIGRAAERDFLTFAGAVGELSGGVYLSIGSAVMSPMVFEKSMSMAQNLARQQGGRIEDHFICVVDLQESSWDWARGEPPEGHPDYYLRYCKSFHRMGGELRYAACDNRDFLLALVHSLGKQQSSGGERCA